MEIWKDVVGYEGLYQVSNLGKIRSLDRYDCLNRFRRGQDIKPRIDTDGYNRVLLSKDGNGLNRKVHRLVYEAFNGEIPEGYEINHIDENKLNNAVDNLEAVTHLQNMRHGTWIERRKCKQFKPVIQATLDGEIVATYKSITDAGKKSPVSRSSIGMCCQGHQKTAGGYIWKYAKEENQ